MQTMIISNQLFPWQYWFHVHPQINSPERSRITLVAFFQYFWKCSCACASSDCLPWELSSHTGCICWSFLGTPPCLRVLSQRFSPARTAQPWWSLEPLRHRGPFTFLSFIHIFIYHRQHCFLLLLKFLTTSNNCHVGEGMVYKMKISNFEGLMSHHQSSSSTSHSIGKTEDQCMNKINLNCHWRHRRCYRSLLLSIYPHQWWATSITVNTIINNTMIITIIISIIILTIAKIFLTKWWNIALIWNTVVLGLVEKAGVQCPIENPRISPRLWHMFVILSFSDFQCNSGV